MATRLLLTLLALMAGLAAQLTPAQARGCALANTEIGTPVRARAQPCVVLATLERPAPSYDRVGADSRNFTAPPHQVPVLPTVLQGIDRSRE